MKEVLYVRGQRGEETILKRHISSSVIGVTAGDDILGPLLSHLVLSHLHRRHRLGCRDADNDIFPAKFPQSFGTGLHVAFKFCVWYCSVGV
jgi:hypothetical protein